MKTVASYVGKWNRSDNRVNSDCISVSFFFFRLIKHTEKLLEEKEEKLCVKVLRTLREMMAIDAEYGEKVSLRRSQIACE